MRGQCLGQRTLVAGLWGVGFHSFTERAVGLGQRTLVAGLWGVGRFHSLTERAVGLGQRTLVAGLWGVGFDSLVQLLCVRLWD